MRWVDFGQEAHGVIAVGQVATGVIAIGQMAFGIIAVGQVARGVFVLGQGAAGFVVVGQAVAGLFYALGMVGVGGRGLGIVLPLIPSLGKPRQVPALTDAARWRAGSVEAGWANVTLEADDKGTIRVDAPVSCRLDARLIAAARSHLGGAAAAPAAIPTVQVNADGSKTIDLSKLRDGAVAPPGGPLLGHLRREGEGWVCDRLMRRPVSRLKQPGYWAWWTFQVACLLALAAALWELVLLPLNSALIEIAKG